MLATRKQVGHVARLAAGANRRAIAAQRARYPQRGVHSATEIVSFVELTNCATGNSVQWGKRKRFVSGQIVDVDEDQGTFPSPNEKYIYVNFVGPARPFNGAFGQARYAGRYSDGRPFWVAMEGEWWGFNASLTSEANGILQYDWSQIAPGFRPATPTLNSTNFRAAFCTPEQRFFAAFTPPSTTSRFTAHQGAIVRMYGNGSISTSIDPAGAGLHDNQVFSFDMR